MNHRQSRLRVHILYEHTLHPHSSGFIRLLRPLTHPLLREHIKVSHGRYYRHLDADIVIVDRFWYPDKISLSIAKEIVNEIRISGARFIYALDDNFFDVPEGHSKPPTQDQLQAVEYFLQTADMVWVTTPYLQECLVKYNRNILVLQNCLDERLFNHRSPMIGRSPFESDRKVIGYMGTLTHDSDLLMVLPVLKAVCARHPEVEIQIIGVAGHSDTHSKLQDLPVRFIQPGKGEDTYPNFMLWYTGWVSWDIAIAPLVDSDFNKAKSDIKFLDYAVIGAPGIYSNNTAYQENVIHQSSGWLVSNQPEEWEKAVESLLDDRELRTRIAAEAQNYLFKSRILNRQALTWLEALRGSNNQ